MTDQNSFQHENNHVEEPNYPSINLGGGNHQAILETSKRKIKVKGAKSKVEDAKLSVKEIGELILIEQAKEFSFSEIAAMIKFYTGVIVDKNSKIFQVDENLFKINEWLELEIGSGDQSGQIGLYIC